MSETPNKQAEFNIAGTMEKQATGQGELEKVEAQEIEIKDDELASTENKLLDTAGESLEAKKASTDNIKTDKPVLSDKSLGQVDEITTQPLV